MGNTLSIDAPPQKPTTPRWRRPWSTALSRLSHFPLLLAQDCHLCGQPGASDVLCGACMAELPRLPVEQCPVCALPAPGAAICGECLRHAPNFDATSAMFAYTFPVDQLVHGLKYAHHLGLAHLFSRLMQRGHDVGADLMIPLPLSRQRLRERGFNQAVEIARPLSRIMAAPLDLHHAFRVVDTMAQAGLPWKERRANVRHAFEYRGELRGKSVVVIDDVMTTGATLDEFARILKLQGAARVTNWVFARTLKHGT